MGRSGGLLCLFCIGLMLLVATKNGPPPGFAAIANLPAVTGMKNRPVRVRPANPEAFRSSKRRVPRGPDPIHNRYLYSPLSRIRIFCGRGRSGHLCLTNKKDDNVIRKSMSIVGTYIKDIRSTLLNHA